MSKQVLYQVIAQYDDQIHGKYPARVVKALELLQMGEEFRPSEFARVHVKDLVKNLTKSKDPEITATELFYKTLRIAKKHKLVEVKESNVEDRKEFLENNPTIRVWYDTLRGSNFQYIKHVQATTRSTFLGKLKVFDEWIVGKNITYKDPYLPRQTHEPVKEETITFTGVESMCIFLKKNRHIIVDDFILLIEEFLNSSIHEGLADVSKLQFKTAINSYFKTHRARVLTEWKPSNGSPKINRRSKMNKRAMSVEDLADMVLLGSPTPRDLATIMIMFHRGLDKSTMCDRFNFQAWEQLVDYFGTESWNDWDLAKCPVPIELVRLKTDVESFGFLEKDAVLCLQMYLDERYEKTGDTPQIEEAMILSKTEKPISPDYPYRMVKRLAKNALRQIRLKNKTTRNGSVFNKISVHLLRHLLETIIENNVKGNSLADSAINHAGTYNDSAEITPDILRAQYATLGPYINIYTKMIDNINGDDPVKVALDLENQKLKNENTTLHDSLDRANQATVLMQKIHTEYKVEVEKRLLKLENS